MQADSDTTDEPRTFAVVTLGCPKNAVDSDKITGSLMADGLTAAAGPETADLIVLNTCAFIDSARRESIDTALDLADLRKDGAQLVVTGCLAERAGDELAAAMPEVDAVIGFDGAGSIAPVTFRSAPTGVRDLLELPRAAPTRPWAYLKVAEGCDRQCAFCAIPTFRGKQRSRTPDAIFEEAKALVAGGVREIILVAQDIAWYGRDSEDIAATLTDIIRRLDTLAADGLQRQRLLYLYPSEVKDPLISTMLELETVVPYFDLSLQHASLPLLRRMRRYGSGALFTGLIEGIRSRQPDAAFRSSFIVGFPGETEDDHEALLEFLQAAELDWAGFFPYSAEAGTHAVTLNGAVPEALVRERLSECEEIQTRITAARRDLRVGSQVDVLVDWVDAAGTAWGRTFAETPEIDGIIRVASERLLTMGEIVRVQLHESVGVDMVASPLSPGAE
ncbi:MAG: 30S ribosomal protein S12 methylthiotransferase RimO [Acidimicrobiia bacterium]